MTDDECEFNHEGICIVANEFPEKKDKPCQFNKNGFCSAKAEDLVSICPDCGEQDCDGGCVDAEDKIMVPKKMSEIRWYTGMTVPRLLWRYPRK